VGTPLTSTSPFASLGPAQSGLLCWAGLGREDGGVESWGGSGRGLRPGSDKGEPQSSLGWVLVHWVWI